MGKHNPKSFELLNMNLPDRLFVEYVQKQFGINRGVYNTIDLWLFENGHNDLIKRRERIMNFLQSVHKDEENKMKKFKFGNGGLSSKLTAYFGDFHQYKEDHLVDQSLIV